MTIKTAGLFLSNSQFLSLFFCHFLFPLKERTQESPPLSPTSGCIGPSVHTHHINQAEEIISGASNYSLMPSLWRECLLVFHARAQIGGCGQGLREPQASKESRGQHLYFIVLDIRGALKKWEAFSSHFLTRKWDCDWGLRWNGGNKKERYKNTILSSEWNPLSCRKYSENFCQERQRSVSWSGWQGWLYRWGPEQGNWMEGRLC